MSIGAMANQFFAGLVSKTSRLAVFVVAVLAMPLVLFTGTAGAAGCGSGNLCLYEHAGYTGIYTEYYSPGTGCRNVSSTFNDIISSLRNYTSRSITFYENANCTWSWTTPLHVGAGGERYNLSDYFYNDKITSFYVN